MFYKDGDLEWIVGFTIKGQEFPIVLEGIGEVNLSYKPGKYNHVTFEFIYIEVLILCFNVSEPRVCSK